MTNKSHSPEKHPCRHCGLELETHLQLDPGRWLHQLANCPDCKLVGYDDSLFFVPLENTEYDYTIDDEEGQDE